MKATKRILLTLVAMVGMTCAWAEDTPEEVSLSPTANANEWTLTMPASDVELEVTYYTDEEVAEMEEAAFTAGVELTANGDGTWTLADMPAFDIELEIEYYDELMGDDATDNTALLASLDGQTTDIYLNRTLAKEKWYTLCLPFDVDLTAEGPLKDVTAKTLSKVENDGTTVTLTFSDAVTSLEAGKPYIVKLPEGALDDLVNPLFEGAAISQTLNDVAVEGGTFKGTYAKVNWEAGTKNVLFLQDNKFYYPESAAWVNAFRGYIELTTPITAEARIILDFGDGEATGIMAVESDAQLEGVWYTLQGVQLDGKPMEKGIYIVNGKKVSIQ